MTSTPIKSQMINTYYNNMSNNQQIKSQKNISQLIQTSNLNKTLKKHSKFQQKQNQTSQSFTQTFKNKCTNLVYKINAFQMPSLFRKNQPINQSTLKIYLLGKQFQTQEQAKQALKSIIWFTYRSNFKVSEELTSDTGWGCLLRVGQMILAAAIKRHFQHKINYQLNQDTINNIIYAFLDDHGPQQKYSVFSMMKIAQKQFNLKPGQWFNIAQIGYLLQKIQNKRSMKGTNNLKILTFNQSVIFLQQIYSAVNISHCKCFVKKLNCKSCHSISRLKNQQQQQSDSKCQSQQIMDSKEQNINNEKQKNNNLNLNLNLNEDIQFKRHLLIIVVARLSIKNIPKSSYQGLLQFLSHPTSLGIMGGIPKKALYFTGKVNQQLVYLDPHYVHQSVNRRNFRKYIYTFSCQQFRKLQCSQVDPSMGFCFYIKNLSDLQSLGCLIGKLKQQKKNDFLSMMWGNSQTERKYQQLTQSFEYNSIQNQHQYSDEEQQHFSA